MTAGNQDDLTFVSLYSGAGGLDLGFIEAGWKPIWANDFEPDSVATYNEAMLRRGIDHRARVGDIDAQPRPEPGSALAVIGGPPCQGFSVAGRMDPKDPRSRHVWTFFDFVELVDPQVFVMENVLGLALNKRWTSLRARLLTRATELGYETNLLQLRASDFGVPQNRDRMFLVGTRDLGFVPPTPVSKDRPPTVRDALALLPEVGAPGNDTRCVARVTPAKSPVLRKSPYAGMLFNGQGRPLNLDAPAPTLPATMGGNRTPILDQSELDGEDIAWVVGYHAHLMAGRPPVSRIPSRLRRLTVEEAAAIQTFPVGFQLCGRTGSRFRQIGNAVPPKLGFAVAKALAGALRRAERAPLESAA